MSGEQWRPGASLQTLRLRARMLEEIRHFFRQRDVLEVDTPALSRAALTSPAISSFHTCFTGPGAAAGSGAWLHTSPEFFMKRLLAAGLGAIYQVAHVFRDGELGPRHNPEFTLLEWYRPDFSLDQLIEETWQLVQRLLAGQPGLGSLQRISYQELFQRFAGIDGLTGDSARLRWVVLERVGEVPQGLAEDDPDGWKDLILTRLIEPQLKGAWCVSHYPASQAALARLDPQNPAVAERFEIYVDGLELANGFRELTDAAEQRRRMQQENAARQALGLPVMPLDDYFLQALEAGLPDCSGVALGFDRLLMLAAGRNRLEEVLAFDWERA